MEEQYYDGLMNIKTGGEKRGFNRSVHYYPYEPTPYHALDILFSQYQLRSSDRIVDFGCGKGRLVFFINHLFNASVVGIEMNEILYRQAIENRNTYLKKRMKKEGRIQFYCCLAEEYPINKLDNRFYFFNPFSIKIFIKIINNILQSVEESGREVEVVLYYGSEDYTYFLDKQTPFELVTEIVIPGLYEHNPYERFLIYHLQY